MGFFYGNWVIVEYEGEHFFFVIQYKSSIFYVLDDLLIQVFLVEIRVDQIIIIYYGPQIQRITTRNCFLYH